MKLLHRELFNAAAAAVALCAAAERGRGAAAGGGTCVDVPAAPVGTPIRSGTPVGLLAPSSQEPSGPAAAGPFSSVDRRSSVAILELNAASGALESAAVDDAVARPSDVALAASGHTPNSSRTPHDGVQASGDPALEAEAHPASSSAGGWPSIAILRIGTADCSGASAASGGSGAACAPADASSAATAASPAPAAASPSPAGTPLNLAAIRVGGSSVLGPPANGRFTAADGHQVGPRWPQPRLERPMLSDIASKPDAATTAACSGVLSGTPSSAGPAGDTARASGRTPCGTVVEQPPFELSNGLPPAHPPAVTGATGGPSAAAVGTEPSAASVVVSMAAPAATTVLAGACARLKAAAAQACKPPLTHGGAVRRTMAQEVEVLARLQHANIVQLLAANLK